MGILDNANKPCLRKLSEQEMKSAKPDLINLYHKIWHRFGNKEYMPKFNSTLVQGNLVLVVYFVFLKINLVTFL